MNGCSTLIIGSEIYIESIPRAAERGGAGGQTAPGPQINRAPKFEVGAPKFAKKSLVGEQAL